MPITIATMGCAVNGPGEARHADFGIAGGIKEGYVFKQVTDGDSCKHDSDDDKHNLKF